MKITFLGAGSLYFETVLREIAETPELAGQTICLYELNAEAAETIRQVGQRYSDHFKAELKITVTSKREEALEGCDYAIGSIGVHGPGQSYHLLDMQVAGRFGMIHTTGDTVGPGGVSHGLRIIPLYVDIARAMEKYCPNAILLNHSNPMAAVCRAISKYTKIQVIGYCHSYSEALTTAATLLEVPKKELDGVFGGVNHVNWLLSLRHKGRDVYPEFKAKMLESDLPARRFTREVLRVLGYYPVGGDRHVIEFFPHIRRMATEDAIEYELESRIRMITSHRLNDELTREASFTKERAQGIKPLLLPKERTPEEMGKQIRALHFGPDIVHVANIPNAGAITNVPDWAVVELKGIVGQHGAKPISVGEMPPEIARWALAQIYAHELLVDAAVQGCRTKAIQALACDPMIRDFDEPVKVLDALVEAHGERLSRFRKS